MSWNVFFLRRGVGENLALENISDSLGGVGRGYLRLNFTVEFIVEMRMFDILCGFEGLDTFLRSDYDSRQNLIKIFNDEASS